MEDNIIELKKKLEELPKGYISVKRIGDGKYHYLQYFDGVKLKSEFISETRIKKIEEGIRKRRIITERIKKLEEKEKNLPNISERAKNFSGNLMMEDRVVAVFENGETKYVDEQLCPLYIKRTHDLESFLASRAIDQTRRNSRILKKVLGISENNEAIISLYSHGACITDNYWFKAKGSKLKYKDIRFDSDCYSETALNGDISYIYKKPKLTPHLTTPGSYEKSWKIRNGKWYLYKKGNEDELFSELFCSKLAALTGIPSAVYEMDDGVIRTENFAAKLNFEPLEGIAGDNDNFDHVFFVLNGLSAGIAKQYLLLIWFDAIIKNVDRHNENCGLLRDRNNGKIVSLAPNFDNNLALLSVDKVLDPDCRKDGFIKVYLNFVKNNETAAKYYKEMNLPVISREMIRKCFAETPIKKDEKKIETFIINRYEYISNCFRTL